MKVTLLLVSILLFYINNAHSAESAARCPTKYPIDDQTMSLMKRHNVIVVGELHGTRESPEFFLEVACNIGRFGGEQTLVGLELGDSEVSTARDAGRKTDASEILKVLQGSKFWTNALDGKTSESYFQLIHDIDKLTGGSFALVGFDRRVTGMESFGETSADFLTKYAQGLQAEGGSKKAVKIILLTGNAHLAQDDQNNSIVNSLSKKGFAVLPIDLVPAGGAAWNCVDGKCGVHQVRNSCASPEHTTNAKEFQEKRGILSYCVGNVSASLPEMGILSSAR